MTFTQILANEDAHDHVDAIEELTGETDDSHVRMRSNLIAKLEADYGYTYILD